MTRSKPAAEYADPQLYLNRELAELMFQARVLHEGLDGRNPLLERVRSFVYFTKNTDELFMKRVGGLKDEMEAGYAEPSVDGRTPTEQYGELLQRFRELSDQQQRCWKQDLEPALRAHGVRIAQLDELREAGREELRERFREQLLPMLTPLSYDPAHPFPFISNLSLSLGVLVREPGAAEASFCRIKVPGNAEPYQRVLSEGGLCYAPTEKVIEANLDLLLPGLEIEEVAAFRITRSGEVGQNDEVAEDLVEMIEEVIERRRVAPPVRLQVAPDMSPEMLGLLRRELKLEEAEIFRQAEPLDHSALGVLADLDRPDLKYPAWTPQTHPRLEAGSSSIFDVLRSEDVLLHHPYQCFSSSTQRFFDEAAADPQVLAIKVAIYRTENDSKVIRALMDAASRGKQVAAMIELKARFDERQNVEWARQLEEQGIHVAYGAMGLKTHTKTALVVRQEGEEVRLYSHVGTGNYHSKTATGYTDLGVLTAREDVGRDLVKVFNIFTGPVKTDRLDTLLIAPTTLKQALIAHIRREAELAAGGGKGRIVAKMNAIEDPDIVAELYRAGAAGVEMDLVVRDICRLRPGLPGTSEAIRVWSLVGRFLEHSRVFYFERGGDPAWYLGSADWMTRNLERRMEAALPVEDPSLRRELRCTLESCLVDNRRRWSMRSDGCYEQLQPEPDGPVRDAQELMMDHHRKLASGEPSSLEPLLEQLLSRRLLIEARQGRVTG